MNYHQASHFLDSLQFHKIKLGLEAMRSFMARVDNPEQRLLFVHVAGTNGKGSVSVTLLTLLAQAGYRVGLYTSPHLTSVRERFRINDNFISEEKFAELATRIRGVLGEEMITYFEFTTALAFLWFAEEKPDLVILETGLGGRLDATNIVIPLVSVITNVSMDHEAYLGDTLSAVAREKAGIIKYGVPVVSAVKEGEGLEEVQAMCRDKGAPLLLAGEAFGVEQGVDGTWDWTGLGQGLGGSHRGLRCAMKGSYQISNASLALAVLELLRERGFALSQEQIREGLLRVHWPGRLECFCLARFDRSLVAEEQGGKDTVCYLLDGAHNPAGVDSLLQTLRQEYSYRRLLVVWGAMVDKDLGKTLPPVAELADLLILTRPEGERSADPEFLLKNVPDALRDRCLLCPTVAEALAEAERSSGPGDLILVAGSLYLVGAARGALLGELAG